jgi:hypothetical protein
MDKLKPSELLKIGSTQVNHTIRQLLDTKMDGDKEVVHSACAVGMMMVAAAGTTEYKACHDVKKKVDDILSIDVPDRYHAGTINLRCAIIDWNDHVRASIPEIINWLEQLGF